MYPDWRLWNVLFIGLNKGDIETIFTFIESQGSQKGSKEFNFDYEKKPTIVGIKGNIF